MMRGATTLLVGALVLTLGGCAYQYHVASGEAVQPLYHRSGIPSTFAYAGGRDFKTVVVGNPFPIDTDTLERVVTGAMQGSYFGPRVNFTTKPSDNARPGYRIVVFFDPPLASPGDTLCGDLGRLVPQRPDSRQRIGLHAGFCVGDQLQSEVKGSMRAVALPDDPAFQRFVGGVMLSLIPAYDPFRGRGNRLRPCVTPFCT